MTDHRDRPEFKVFQAIHDVLCLPRPASASDIDEYRSEFTYLMRIRTARVLGVLSYGLDANTSNQLRTSLIMDAMIDALREIEKDEPVTYRTAETSADETEPASTPAAS